MATSQGGESTGATQWAETCHHSSSAFSWQRETLDTAGGRRPAARRNSFGSRGSSSGVLPGACPVPVDVGVRRGWALGGGGALLCCGSCQRHGEAFGGERGKVLSPVGFAQRQIIAVTQTVAFQNKQPQEGETAGAGGRERLGEARQKQSIKKMAKKQSWR